MKRFLKITAIPLLAISLMFSCSSGKDPKNAGEKKASGPQMVEGFIVKPSVVSQSITVSGTLKSFEETVLMTDISGRVVNINLPEGKFVKKGTVLVKLFDADMQATLKKLQTQLKIAEQTKKRQAELLAVSGISELEYEQTGLQVSSITDDIEVLKAQITKTEVLAPYDGTIGLRNISVGAQVTPGTPLATIRELNQMKLDFSVPEKYAGEIRAGKKVRFSIQGADTLFSATITAAEGGIDAATRNLKVRALVDQRDGILNPGSFAKVEIPLTVKPDALMIPTQAVIPQERNKKVIVARDGQAAMLTVKTGIRRPDDIEVTEGLKVGDTVVVTGVMFLKPKSALKFSKIRK